MATKKMQRKPGAPRTVKKLINKRIGAVQTLRSAPVTPDPIIKTGGG